MKCKNCRHYYADGRCGKGHNVTDAENNSCSSWNSNEPDNVKAPAHYTDGGIECIDAMIAAKGVEKVATFCELNAFKYLWRSDKKGVSEEDLKKAQRYLEMRIEILKRKRQ